MSEFGGQVCRVLSSHFLPMALRGPEEQSPAIGVYFTKAGAEKLGHYVERSRASAQSWRSRRGIPGFR